MAAASPATSIGPVSEAEALMGSSKDASGVARILEVGPKVSLALEEDTLVVRDRTVKKPRRVCGFEIPSTPQPDRRIPVYNILWIEVSPDESSLTIDYAVQTSKTRLAVAKLSFPFDPTVARSRVTKSFVDDVQKQAYADGAAKPAKRAYVLVNPHAGPGGADRIWDRQVRPIFEAARMALTVVRTTHGGQARELARALDADAYDVLVPCSGDGLPHEVFNGLADRADARAALGRLAVAHIPCGSGNAMSCNLYGTHRPSIAALAIVKGVPTPLDLVSVTQEVPREDGTKEVRRTLSFLSQAVGVIAEVDLATEHLRFLGEQRFALGFIKVVLLQKKVYPVDLAVKVELEKEDVKGHYQLQQSGSNIGDSAAPAAAGGSTEGQERIKQDGLANLVGEESGMSTPATDEGQSQSQGLGLPSLKYGTIADKLPSGWEMLPQDKLGNFYCGNMAYMAPNANFFPAALASDGLMDLVTIDGDISAMKAFELQKFVETGHFFDSPLVKYRKVSAFRILPRQDKGYVSIDGERFPFAPFQAEVHRGLGLVLSRGGKFEAPGPRGWEQVTAAERILA